MALYGRDHDATVWQWQFVGARIDQGSQLLLGVGLRLDLQMAQEIAQGFADELWWEDETDWRAEDTGALETDAAYARASRAELGRKACKA